MNHRFLLLLLLFLLTILGSQIPHTSAQSTGASYSYSVPGLIWATWGGKLNDQGNGVATDSAGNIYIVGSTDSFGPGGTKALLLKYNANGSFLWAKTWSASNGDFGRAVAVDAQGLIYMAGDTLGLGVFLAKFDTNGYLIWQKNWSGAGTEHASGIALDQGGDAYVAGATTSFGAGNYDFFLLKFDTTGALTWQRSWGGNDTDMGEGIALDPSGIYITGFTRSLGANQAAVLLKFNSTGSLLWQRAWNDSTSDLGLPIALDVAGNLYIAGSTKSSGAGGLDAIMMKLDSAGNVLWQKTWGSNNVEMGEGIAVDKQGNLGVTGFTNSYGSSNPPTDNAFILKLNTKGELLSNFIMGPTGVASHSLGLTMDQSGNLVATGFASFLPPLFYVGNSSLGGANYRTAAPAINAETPNLPVGTPNGIVSSLSGSQDQFYGYNGNDVLLLKSFARPANFTVTFNGGRIIFDGRYLGVNRTQNITEGTHLAQMYLSEHDTGFMWNATGGITISNPANPFYLAVTVTGPGTLTGIVYCCDFYQYQYHPHPALPQNILMVVTLVALPALLFRRRLRRDDLG